jgi:hypothetical protein
MTSTTKKHEHTSEVTGIQYTVYSASTTIDGVTLIAYGMDETSARESLEKEKPLLSLWRDFHGTYGPLKE